jgi:thymidylate synthase
MTMWMLHLHIYTSKCPTIKKTLMKREQTCMTYLFKKDNHTTHKEENPQMIIHFQFQPSKASK